jgi:hypothetical protein
MCTSILPLHKAMNIQQERWLILGANPKGDIPGILMWSRIKSSTSSTLQTREGLVFLILYIEA